MCIVDRPLRNAVPIGVIFVVISAMLYVVLHRGSVPLVQRADGILLSDFHPIIYYRKAALLADEPRDNGAIRASIVGLRPTRDGAWLDVLVAGNEIETTDACRSVFASWESSPRDYIDIVNNKDKMSLTGPSATPLVHANHPLPLSIQLMPRDKPEVFLVSCRIRTNSTWRHGTYVIGLRGGADATVFTKDGLKLLKFAESSVPVILE